jgi:MFS family permease
VLAGGWLTDRFGPRRVQIWSLVSSAAMLLVLWRARSQATLALTIAVLGFVSDAFRPANGAAISAAVVDELRARAFSLMSLAINLGLSVGLPIAGLLARAEFDWLFWIDAGTAFGAALVLLALSPIVRLPARAASAAPPALSPWRDGVFVGVVALQGLTATVLFQFFGALPVFLTHDLGFDEAGVGLALALNTVVTAAFGMLVVRRVERRGAFAWIGIGSFLICVGYGLNGLVVGRGLGATSLALTSILVWSVGEMFFFPLGASFVSRRAPPQAVGRYLSVYHLAFAFAFVLAPFFGTSLYEHSGPRALWGACALAGVAVLVAYTWLARRAASRDAA